MTIKRGIINKEEEQQQPSAYLLYKERAVFPPLAILGDEGDRREKKLFVFERSEFEQIPRRSTEEPLKNRFGAHFLGSVLLCVQKNEPGFGAVPHFQKVIIYKYL